MEERRRASAIRIHRQVGLYGVEEVGPVRSRREERLEADQYSGIAGAGILKEQIVEQVGPRWAAQLPCKAYQFDGPGRGGNDVLAAMGFSDTESDCRLGGCRELGAEPGVPRVLRWTGSGCRVV